MTEFMHHIVENREYIQRDMDLFRAYRVLAESTEQVTTVPWTTDPWAREGTNE